jgi:hypothetical protein
MEKIDTKPKFNALKVVVPVLIMLLMISFWSSWYSRHVSIPRYCENPAQTLHYLQHLLTDHRPAGEDARRPYLIASKLLFLIPPKTTAFGMTSSLKASRSSFAAV